MSDEAAGSNPAGESVSAVESVQTGQVEAEVQQQESQAPAKSAREAVERAMAKVGEPEAGEKPLADKPADNRDPATGKFTKKAEPADPAKVMDKPAEKLQTEQAAQVAAPQRFSKAAQAEWAKVPEVVRQETERAVSELSQGIEKYKGAAEAFEPVRKYHDMAQQSGTTLDKALEAYVGIEQALRSDPVAGMLEVCKNIGVSPAQMVQAMAQRLQGQPVQVQRQDSAEVSQLKSQVAALEKQLGEFGKTFSETQQQTQAREAQARVEAFAKDHPYFDDLADSIAQMLETKFAKDLPDAYEKAIRLNPDVAAKIEAEKAAKAAPKPDPAQTREKANKSITGSPAAGSHPGTRKPPGTPREALQNAFANVGLS